jgi:hypothetical protein
LPPWDLTQKPISGTASTHTPLSSTSAFGIIQMPRNDWQKLLL